MKPARDSRQTKGGEAEWKHASVTEKIDPREALFEALLQFRNRDFGADPLYSFVQFCALHPHTPSQLCQDLFVLFVLKNKRNGFFVEFGATDGVGLSNTYILEKKFGWSGILAEPGHRWHGDLSRNRACTIDRRCVWSETGAELDFIDTRKGEFSTVRGFENRDFNRHDRVDHVSYKVTTVSLDDLLSEHGAPPVIDYMSVDTEGTEYQILNAFDFGRHHVQVLTIEHAHVASDRERIRTLMQGNGFTNVFSRISKWDDWYINNELLKS